MKKFPYYLVIAIWLVACAPIPNATPTPYPTLTSYPTSSPTFLYSTSDYSFERVGGSVYHFDQSWMVAPTFDCVANVFSADQSYPLSLLRWVIDPHEVSLSTTHPSNQPYLDFTIIGNDEDILDIERYDLVRFKSETVAQGPCGTIVGEGWIYTDTITHDADFSNDPQFAGTIILSDAYVNKGTFPTDIAQSIGGFWQEANLGQVALHWQSHTQPFGQCFLWSSTPSHSTLMDLVTEETIRVHLGQQIMLFGTTYPPTVLSSITGIQKDYIVVTLPEACY